MLLTIYWLCWLIFDSAHNLLCLLTFSLAKHLSWHTLYNLALTSYYNDTYVCAWMPYISHNIFLYLSIGDVLKCIFGIFEENLLCIFCVMEVFNYITNRWRLPFFSSATNLLPLLSILWLCYPFNVSANKVHAYFVSRVILFVSANNFLELYTLYHNSVFWLMET